MGVMASLLGGALGFSLGGPVGGVIGALLGGSLSGGARPQRQVMSPQQEAQAVFFVSLFSMLAKLAKADGHVSREEIEVVTRFMQDGMGLDAKAQAQAIRIFQAAKDAPSSFDDFARQFAQVFSSQPDMRRSSLDLLVRLALADGKLDKSEKNLLERAARIFGLDDQELTQILRQYGGDMAHYYAILGVEEDADLETVKRRYRKLAVDFHPDKVMGKGLPEEFVHFAETRFREIREAYDKIIEKRRGRPGSSSGHA